MHPTSRLFMLASLGFTALGVAAVISVQSDAQPPLAQPAFPTIPLPSPDLANWVSSTPNRALWSCPHNPASRTFFAFVKTPTTCLVDGPYKWQGQDWFVQRMYVSDPANTPPHDVIRVCSRSAVHSDPNQFVPGPCQTAKGAGPLGCEICRVKGVIQTRR